MVGAEAESAAVSTVAVQFPSGREFLAASWGFLRDGGVILSSGIPEHLVEGAPLVLDLRILTLKVRYRLAGRVVRRSEARTFIAFDPGQEQDALLNAAWADNYDVPQRKHRRVPASGQVGYRVDGGAEALGELLDLSPFGLRLRTEGPIRVGARVALRLPSSGELVEGKVRWSSPRREAGIEFSRAVSSLPSLLNRGR